RMLPALLERGAAGAAEIRAIARDIAAFHARAETDARIAAFGRVPGVRANIEENFAQVAPFVGRTIARERFDALHERAERFFARHGALIEARADAGRVRDGHGDLRSDSIVLREDGSVCVMDCIEFNERLRCGDVASDLAFLAMDLDFRRFAPLADELCAAYLDAAPDETLPAMLPFYRAYRAWVRGKVDCLLLDEDDVPPPRRAEAEDRARRYFALAARYPVPSAPAVVVMCGLSGTGKTWIATAAACRLGAAWVSSDVARKELAGVPAARRLDAAYGEGVYTPEARARVYAAMHGRARAHLAAGLPVVLDATYGDAARRAEAAALAWEAGVPLVIAEVRASDDVVRAHLGARQAAGGGASDAGWSVYLAQRADVSTPDAGERGMHVTLDGGAPVAESVRRILDALGREG